MIVAKKMEPINNKKLIAFETTFSMDYHPIMGNYINVSGDVVKAMGGNFGMRVLCSVNGHTPFHCAIVSLGDGNGFIMVNTKKQKEYQLKKGEKIAVVLYEDTSKYGMEMPKELEEVLLQDEEGAKRFENLPDGKKRNIIYYVSKTKSSQLRIDKSIVFIENLKRQKPGKESISEILNAKMR